MAVLVQGRFVDMRMQDNYNILKTLQDLSSAEHTAGVFLSCCGLSNLCSVISWPHAEMRHVRWAAVSFLKEVHSSGFLLTFVLQAEQSATGFIDYVVLPMRRLSHSPFP